MPLMSPCLEQTFQGHHRPDPGCEHGSNSTACSRQRASGQPSRCVGSSTAEGPAACCVPWASPYPPLGRTNAQGPLQLGQSEARDLLQASGNLWSQGHATGPPFPFQPGRQNSPEALITHSYLHCLHSARFPSTKKTCLQNQVSLRSWQAARIGNVRVLRGGGPKAGADL